MLKKYEVNTCRFVLFCFAFFIPEMETHWTGTEEPFHILIPLPLLSLTYTGPLFLCSLLFSTALHTGQFCACLPLMYKE